jgi:uncharacterized protein YdgA (DUF945 family)
MKKALIALTVLILLYPVVTWVMGFAIEHRVEHLAYQGELMVPQLHLLQQSRRGILTSDENSSYEVGSTLKITRHYHRGWYSSVDEANVEMSIAALNALQGLRPAAGNLGGGTPDRSPVRFLLRTVIYHGPICGTKCIALARAETHMTVTGALQDSLTRLFGNKEPITIRSRFAFFGGGSTTISSPAFEHIQLGQDLLLSWGGVEGTMHYGAWQNWYDLAATAPALRLEGSKGAVEIDGMNFNVHGKRVLRTLFEGDSRIELKHLTLTGPDRAPQFSADDLLFASHEHAQDRFMSVSYQLGTGAARTRPLTLSSAHVDLTWKHLGLEPLESLSIAMRSPAQEQNASVAPAMRVQNTLTALKRPVAALLLEQPEMNVDRLSMATAQGQALVTGAMHLVGFSASDLDTPALLIPKLDLRLDLAIDEAFLTSLPGAGTAALTQMQAMVDQGYMTRANGTLRTQLIFRGGQSTLNGKPFSSAAMRPAMSGNPGTMPPRGLSTPPGASVPPGSAIAPRRKGTVP